MMVELQDPKYGHSFNKKGEERRTMLNFRYYIDRKFGHGFFHTLVEKDPQIGPMYMNQYPLTEQILADLFYRVGRLVNLSAAYLFEDFNLYLFRGSPKDYY